MKALVVAIKDNHHDDNYSTKSKKFMEIEDGQSHYTANMEVVQTNRAHHTRHPCAYMAQLVDQSTGKPVSIDELTDPSTSTIEDHMDEEYTPTGNTPAEEPSEVPSYSMDITGTLANQGISQLPSPGETTLGIPAEDNQGHTDREIAHQQTLLDDFKLLTIREIHELAEALDINETIWEAEGPLTSNLLMKN